MLLGFTQTVSANNIIFPPNDPYIMDKLYALQEINDIMGPGNSVDISQKSNKVILWANEARILPRYIDGVKQFILSDLPSFTAATIDSEDRVRKEIERVCECSIEGKEIAGIIIANPYKAATMYFKHGWNGHRHDEVDGDVPPLVIIYHEFSHIKDFIINPAYFSDMAAQMDKQWLNKAEKSASLQQNDFTISLGAQRGVHARIRRSYGRNTLYDVSDIFDF
jgi:hypothetical protein